MGKFPVCTELFRAVINVAVHIIGIPLINQGLNDLNDGVYILRRSGMHGRGADSQSLCVRIVFRDILVGQLLDRNTKLVCLIDHLIVNICEILHKFNRIALILQIAAQGIEQDKRPRVSNMEKVIHSGPAGIHPDLAGLNRDELLFFPGQGIIQIKLRINHGPIPPIYV